MSFTLKELGVQTGDVVRYDGTQGGDIAEYTVQGWERGLCYHDGQKLGGSTNMSSSAVWELVSRRSDPVNHPPHYTGHASGVECIQITEHMNFCRGNAVKYIWRCGEKGDPVQDLKKARWYIDREIERLEKAVDNSS